MYTIHDDEIHLVDGGGDSKEHLCNLVVAGLSYMSGAGFIAGFAVSETMASNICNSGNHSTNNGPTT